MTAPNDDFAFTEARIERHPQGARGDLHPAVDAHRARSAPVADRAALQIRLQPRDAEIRDRTPASSPLAIAPNWHIGFCQVLPRWREHHGRLQCDL